MMPAPLSSTLTTQLQEYAMTTFTALNCRDYARADFMITEQGEVYLLELNTIPGMTAMSLLPHAVQHAGIAFSQLIGMLVQNCQKRHGQFEH